MALQLQMDAGAGWVTVNLVAEGVTSFRFRLGYSHPATLEFRVRQPQHTSPIPAYAAVRFWDDADTDRDGNPFSSANPLFLGHVEDIDPGTDSNDLKYTCYDPTARALSKIQIMSTEWDTPTTQGLGAVPRLIFNPAIDNDDDWSFARGFDLTIGQMIAIILDDAQMPLEAVKAAPGTGDPYVAADLNGLTYIPQEKVVFTGEPIRSGVMRLIDDWAPEYRMLFNPQERRWRFGNIRLSPAVTYTLNDFTGDHPVLKLNMDRSLDNRYTAIKIYGPEAVENEDISVTGGGLLDISDGPVLDTYGAGAVVEGRNKYQIADEDKRRMGRLLATPIEAPLEEIRIGPNAWTQYSMSTRTPTLMAKYKNNSAGSDAWQTLTGWFFDQQSGILDFRNSYVYRYNANPEIEGGILQPNYENPEDVRLIYPSYIEPLYIRVPATGYEGTAFTQHGLENELKIYDESLAVGYLYGTPVTSATRLAKFEVLANAMLQMKKNVLYHGGMTLEGIDYQFHLLDRRVNIAGVDGNGNSLTTGWEAMGAYVTDVEYDFEEQTTTISFSSDESEMLGFDPEQIKKDLRIGAAYISQVVTAYAELGTFRAHTEWGTPYLAQSLTVGGSVTPVIVDPFFGTMDTPIG